MPYITVNERKIFYEEQGDGFPLLFGHAYLWNAAQWQPQVEVLSESWRCIVPELWGHGRSDSLPENPYSIEAMAGDCLAFTKALGIERFAVIGLDIGGMWGASLALDHPEEVAALVLMDTSFGAEPEDIRTAYLAILDEMEQAGAVQPYMQEALVSLFFPPSAMEETPALVYRLMAALQFMPQERIPDIAGIGRALLSRPSILDRLGGIKAPTLVAVGADNRPACLAEAKQAAKTIPGARLEVIEGAGALSNLEQPEQVTGLLSNFLNEALQKRDDKS